MKHVKVASFVNLCSHDVNLISEKDKHEFDARKNNPSSHRVLAQVESIKPHMQ